MKVEVVDIDAKGINPEAMVLVLVLIFRGDIRTAFVGLGSKECRSLGVAGEPVDAEGMYPEEMVLVFLFLGDMRSSLGGQGGKECRPLGGSGYGRGCSSGSKNTDCCSKLFEESNDVMGSCSIDISGLKLVFMESVFRVLSSGLQLSRFKNKGSCEIPVHS